MSRTVAVSISSTTDGSDVTTRLSFLQNVASAPFDFQKKKKKRGGADERTGLSPWLCSPVSKKKRKVCDELEQAGDPPYVGVGRCAWTPACTTGAKAAGLVLSPDLQADLTLSG